MVVAERSRDRIGDEVVVRVTSVLTTANGRMVFGQPVVGDGVESLRTTPGRRHVRPTVMTVAAIVPAAGRGERLGPGQPKALRTLGGVPMLVHAVSACRARDWSTWSWSLRRPDGVADVKALLALHEIGAEVLVVVGGAERQDSVARALEALPPEVDVVLVHDAARPLAPSELVDAVARAVLAGHGAVVPGVPMTDTVKRVA